MVSSFFTNKNNFSYEEATYTISGVGGAESTFNFGSKGRIYNIPLQEINGDTVVIKAFAMDSILRGKIGHEKVKLNPEDFPHLTKEELQEVSKPVSKRHLPFLQSGHPNPTLQTGWRPRSGLPISISRCFLGRGLLAS